MRLSITVAPTRSHQPASTPREGGEDWLFTVAVPHTLQYEPVVSDSQFTHCTPPS